MEDIQGEGGGGYLKSNAYINPALSVSTHDLSSNGKVFRGCNDFEVVEASNTSSVGQTFRTFADWSRSKARKICSKKTLYRRLPILSWLPQYTTEKAVGDLVAGITVGLTVIPQALAYSNIAHLPLQYGLYTSFLGCFIYIFLGGCKDVPFGPTAIVSIITYETVGDKGAEHATLLCLLTGAIQLLMGLFGFGFIIDFVSGPVASGFTSAVALIILTSQVKDLLGITAPGSVFIHTWSNIFKNIHQTKVGDAVLGFLCILSLLILRLGSQIPISTTSEDGKPRTPIKIWRNRLLWFIATSRNAILVVASGSIGYYYYKTGHVPFSLIGYVPQGLPNLQMPKFEYEKIEGNSTVVVTFKDMVSDLGSGIIIVPLLALLENIAICKAFANGKTVDSTQEFLAMGICNILNSFVQAFPASGSLSRSAVQHSSGSRTPLCSVYAGILVVLALLFFTPCFYFIPKAALAAVLIAAVIFMVEVKVVKPMWRTKKSDLIPGLGTFIACLILPLERGVFIGVAINLIFILHQAARPKITIERLKTKNGFEYLMLTPDRCLIFPSVDYVRNLVTKYSTKEKIVVLDCSYIYGADYTAACVIQILTADFASRKQPLIFYNLKPSVSAVFEGLSPKDFVVVYNEDELERLIEHKSFVIK
ncbi:sodium-independent sulfate anion transporter isoform X2 [Coccinella septempunctata]|nr:sodium-independent sulfate anion transporter isoform X2 [Coccinella septempunctata]XP_044759532.1 sodium-independent sulfate anion transporter isoform X2 [Coccinella septempunctata]